jgi:hypothetical protein
MRTRQLHRDFWVSESIASVDFFHRLLFQALWGLADREGLVLFKPARIKASAFPYDDVSTSTVHDAVLHLRDSGHVEILASNDGDVDECIYIRNFKKYQHIHVHEAASVLSCRYIPGNVSKCTPASASASASALPPNGDGGATPEPVASPAYCLMPVKEGEEPITEADVAHWESLYGRIDVRHTLLKIVGYWSALPRNKRKTRTGIRKSINTWLAKDDDKAPVGSLPSRDSLVYEREPWKNA